MINEIIFAKLIEISDFYEYIFKEILNIQLSLTDSSTKSFVIIFFPSTAPFVSSTISLRTVKTTIFFILPFIRLLPTGRRSRDELITW